MRLFNTKSIAVRLILSCLTVIMVVEYPVRAVVVPYDFYSDSNIQFYDPNACDPGGGSSSSAATSSAGSSQSVSYTANQATIDTDGSGGSGGSSTFQAQTNLRTDGKLNDDSTSLHAGKINFYVLYGAWAEKRGISFGDIARVEYKGKTSYAVFGDNHGVGSENSEWSEISSALAKSLGGSGDGTTGTLTGKIKYTIYPGSHKKLDVKPSASVGVAATELPLDSLQAKIDEFGAQLSGGSTATSSSSTASCCPANAADVSDDLQGGQNSEKAFNFFVANNWTKEQAAGIVGNLLVESNAEPQRLQGTPPGTETKASDFSGGSGWGIAQWTPGSKFIGPTKAAGKDPNSLLVQLETIHDGLNNKGILKEPVAGQQLKTTNNVEDATEAFQGSVGGSPYYGYERPASRTATIGERTSKAKAVLRKFGGGGSGAISSNASPTGNPCTCTESASGSVDVVLDPGHAPGNIKNVDSRTGVEGTESANQPEMDNMWEVSEKIRRSLGEKGYTVKSTKENNNSEIGLIDRAKVANRLRPKIAVSLHSTPGSFGTTNAHWGVTPQEVGRYRQVPGKEKKVFEDASIANKSQDYAEKIKSARDATGDKVKVVPLDASFRDPGRTPATGDISLVQLYSKVPWVYNEVGASGLNKDKYAEGIAKGIQDAIGPADSSGGSSADCLGGSGSFTDIIKSYAWPEYHDAPYLNRKPAWEKVADDSSSHYVGGSVNGVKGIDCGGFVTMAIRNSGIDRKYNPGKGPTGSASDESSQWGYLDKNWEKINVSSTRDLQPGDVAINGSHTFLHIGDVAGFDSKFASASYSTSGNGRAPMSGQGDAMDSKYTWYRKK